MAHSADIFLVDQNSPSPQRPYASPATAAKRIGDALRLANAGDIVIVAPGVYQENLLMRSGVVLISKAARAAWLASGTQSLEEFVSTKPRGFLFGQEPVINGGGRRVIFCNNLLASTAIVGFHIRKGKAPFGAGILCHKSPILIACNLLKDNTAEGLGGGLYIHFGTGTRVFCSTFESNNARWYGGGLLCEGASGTRVARCVFRKNDAGDGGGGLFCEVGDVNCEDSLFEENHVLNMRMGYWAIATSQGNGGGFGARSYTLGKPTTFAIDGCDFNGNACARDGGGLSGHFVTGFSIMRSNFENNAASDDGGGLYFTVASTGTITGAEQTLSLVRSNRAKVNGGGLHASFHSSIDVRNYHFLDNHAETGSGGGISLRNMRLTIDNGRIEKNRAKQYGGGIFELTGLEDPLYVFLGFFLRFGLDPPYASLTVKSCDNINENSSVKEGGGIAVMRESGIEKGIYFRAESCILRDNWSHLRALPEEPNTISEVVGCAIKNPDAVGILVESSGPLPSLVFLIQRNQIFYNKGGIQVLKSKKVGIHYNKVISFNDPYGLNTSESEVDVKNNYFRLNCPEQVLLEAQSTATMLQNCLIATNGGDIGPSARGVVVDATSVCTAQWNNIVGHSDFGVKNLGTTVVNAGHNYWGHESGPTHPSNPGGQGDRVSDYVDFSDPQPSWLPW